MPAFEQHIPSTGGQAHIVVSDELAATFRSDPSWVEVVEVGDVFVPAAVAEDVQAALEERADVQDEVADLKGDKLDAAVKAAKIDGASTMSADEKRAALVEARLQPIADNPDADFDNDPQES